VRALGATGRAPGPVGRVAASLADGRAQVQLEQTIEAMLARRVWRGARSMELPRTGKAGPASGQS
jgi:hypothetical protein